MRILINLFLLLFTFSNTMAQEFKTDVSYKYIFANNGIKPFKPTTLADPLFRRNNLYLYMELIIQYLSYLNLQKSLIMELIFPTLTLGVIRENENLVNVLNLHFLNLGYIIHYQSNEKTKVLYTDLIISAVSSGLFRNVDDEPFEYDDTRSKAFGIGGDLSIKAGYYLNLKNKTYLSPFVLVGYTPFIYSPNTEAVINQTKGLVSNNWAGIFTIQFGLTFHIRQRKND